MKNVTVGTDLPLRRGDWLRYQTKSNQRVLEGFVQEMRPGEGKVLIGKAAGSLDGIWYALPDIAILHHQSR